MEPQFPFLEITSFQNERVRQARDLKNKRDRDSSGLFPVEGFREISRAHAARAPVQSVFFAPALFAPGKGNELPLIAELVANGARAYQVPAALFAKMSYREGPDGLLAICRKWDMTLRESDLENEGLFCLVLERLEKPGNLGTILRAADAVGVDLVILADPVTDCFNPNVVRASTGALFSLKVRAAASADLAHWLPRHGVRLYCATPEAQMPYWQGDYRGKTAILLGSEQYGLSADWRAGTTQAVSIPMRGQMDSLNVAMAAAVVLFEAGRQRYVGGA